MEELEFLRKKVEKLVKKYKDLEDYSNRLQVENKYLDSEVAKLKKRVSELSDFEIKQKKAASKIRKVLNKLKSLNQGI